jgi:hypothetical protein
MTNIIITGIILIIIPVLFSYVWILGGLQCTLYPGELCSVLISHNSIVDSRDKCVAALVQR